MHAAGEGYLPKLAGEDETEYASRIKRADFFNATWRTIAGLTGMAFRKDPAVDVPAAIEPFLEDIDLAGSSIYGVAKLLTEEVLEYGRVGLLVDHPPMPDNVSAISRAVAERMGLRPTLQVYEALRIRNWRFDRIGNATVLVQVVLAETAEVFEDEFEAKCEDRYRVLDLDETGTYRQRVFKVAKDGKDELIEGPIYPLMNGNGMDFIPFYIIGPNGIATGCEEPPLIDLVDANIAHYQVNADYRHGLHFTGLPTLFLAGVVQEADSAPFYIGGQAAITSPHPEAKGMFIEYSGQGLGAIEKALAGLERRMAILGARMLADEARQVETLGATQIKRAGENSVMAAIVISVSQCIERALGVMAQWVGASGEVTFQISREFVPAGMDAQQLTAVVSAWQSGALSEAEMLELFKRGDVIDAEKTLEEHQEEVGAGAPVSVPISPAVEAA
jgi:hypothetical protein